MAAINKSTIDISETAFKENRQFLNWPGLQYLFYSKIKPMIKDSVGKAKSTYDDENWYISYDICTGEVYLATSEDNQSLVFDASGFCGKLVEDNEDFFGACGTIVNGKRNAGLLQLRINGERSAILGGFLDERYGPIGPDGYKSDEIGFASGKLYVELDMGNGISAIVEDGHNSAVLNRRIDQIREDLDSHVKIQQITTGGGYDSSTIENPEFQSVVIDAEGHILESVDNDDNVFVADVIDNE